MSSKTIICALMLLSIKCNAECSIVTNTGLQFSCPLGEYSGCSAIAQLALNCSTGSSLSISLSQGYSNMFIPRQMVEIQKHTTVNYNVYLDPNQQQIFGDGTQGTEPLNVACSGYCNYNFYGFIQSSMVKAGTYLDTPTLLINY